MDVSIQVKTMVDEDKTIVFRPTGGKSGMRVSSTEIKVKLNITNQFIENKMESRETAFLIETHRNVKIRDNLIKRPISDEQIGNFHMLTL